jgi:hypothetical protein
VVTNPHLECILRGENPGDSNKLEFYPKISCVLKLLLPDLVFAWKLIVCMKVDLLTVVLSRVEDNFMLNLKLDFFVHPIPLFAVALMAINDHWLKYAFPGWLTGKLSDFAGIFYFPIFILAVVCVALQLAGVEKSNQRVLTTKNLWLAVLSTDFLLVLIKLSAPAARWIEAVFAEILFKIQLVQDPTDLIALVMNAITFWYMRKYLTGSAGTPRSSPDK